MGGEPESARPKVLMEIINMRVVYFDGKQVDLDDLLERYNYLNGKKFGFKRCPYCKTGTKHYKADDGGGDIKALCLVCGNFWYYTGD